MVIETKDYKGWIFAHAKYSYWTQVLSRGRFDFRNPIHQNFRHLRAVEELLDFLPPGVIKPVVIFTSRAKFASEMPVGVYNLAELIEYLRTQTGEVMSLDRMEFCVGRLETARIFLTNQTDVEHVESLRRRLKLDLE